jgi:tRNA dimethylallyltransferase
VLKLGLVPTDRGHLHARIAQRFDAMLAAGLVAETARLLAQPGVHADLPAMRAVGYRQAVEFLRGESTAAGFRERGIQATRQLAKRQMTWLRGDPALRHFEPWQATLQERVSAAIALFLGPDRS